MHLTINLFGNNSFEVLEERGFDVKLVDPHAVRQVPGRKMDVQDCQWLQELHTSGLLRGAFRPEDEVCVLRSYLRQRSMLVAMASRSVQHMQKALAQMHRKLTEVVSDITGKTGMTIIRAILEGERDSQVLATHRDKRCKHDQATLAKALEGHWRAEHLFALQQAVEQYEFIQQQLRACDQQIEACLQAFVTPAEMEAPRPAPARKRRARQRHTPDFEGHAYLESMTGVNLTQIDGIDSLSALKIISEIGLDMTRWPTGKHFASWLGLCPGNKQSGGKRYRVRSTPTANRAATALRVAAQGLAHSHSALGAYYRRMRARLGAPKAMTATAHKLARLVYSMLRYGTDYVDAGRQAYERQYRDRVLTNLQRKARGFGYQLVHNWLRVSDTAERSQVDQRIGHQLHAIVPLLDTFKSEQQPLEFINCANDSVWVSRVLSVLAELPSAECLCAGRVALVCSVRSRHCEQSETGRVRHVL